MSTATSPVEVSPAVAEAITHVVTEFAHESGLQSVAWYHDAPVWLVERRDGEWVRRVQVTPFTGPASSALPVLKLIPSLSRVQKNRVTATLPASKLRPGIKVVDIWETVPGGLPPRMLSPDEVAQGLYQKLDAAWDAAIRLDVADVTPT